LPSRYLVLSVPVLGLALGVSVSPLAAEAQQAGKVWRIGILAGPEPGRPRWTPFRERLRGLGYVEGQNIVLEWRSSGGRAGSYPDLAAELVRLKVDVIVAGDNPAIAASGFARSLARPGGNLTGLTSQGTDLQSKIMHILKQAAPSASRVAVLWVPTEPGRQFPAKEAQGAARALGLQTQLVEARDPADLDRVFAAMARERMDAVLVHPRFELKINLKTAKALGLTIPASLLLQADFVIE
jgi:putative ABC transport system substrate-binding protein